MKKNADGAQFASEKSASYIQCEYKKHQLGLFKIPLTYYDNVGTLLRKMFPTSDVA